MANVVEYLVKIRDLASGPMRSLATNAEGSLNRVTNRTKSLSTSIDGLNSRMDSLARTRDMSLNTSQIRRANQEIEQLEQRRDRLQNMGRSGGGMLGMGLAFAGLGLLGIAGAKTFQAGMERQLNNKSFEIMAGKTQGAQLSGNLNRYAADTVYGNEVFGEAKTLLGFGVAAKNVMPVISMLGDISGANAERMQSLSLAFAQTTAAGKLMGQDLLQYNAAGFNPLQALAMKTGKSMAYLKDQMSKGKVTINDVVMALQYATGPAGKFYQATKKLGDTPTGKIAAFTGALSTMAGTLGEKVMPFFGKLAQFGSELLGNVPAMYAIAGGIGAMTGAWALYTAWTQRAAIWQGILAVAAFWPLAVIGLVVGAAVWAAKSFDGWGKSIKGLWTITKLFVADVGLGFKDFFQTVVYEGELFYLRIKDVFQYVGGAISNIAKAMKLALSGDFGGAKKALTMEIRTNASAEIEKLKSGHAADRAANEAQLAANKKAMQAAWGQVGLSKIKQNKTGESTFGKYDFLGNKPGSAPPSGAADSAKGIAAGGVRNITINIAKQGIDNIHITTSTLKEGIHEIEQKFIEMFNQVVNSGSAIVPSN